MEKKRVLYVSSEIVPFLPESELSETVRNLVQGTHESDTEIRIFMPRFGCINERRHQLHEVIRLSGMNLIIDDTDHPLIIKVASIPQARMQVYFIDNEEYFKRKAVLNDDKGKFFEDNDERAMFFCKGVLETVKKLGWAPDIVHSHGWMASLLPLYLKKQYNDDPYFSETKAIHTVYDEKVGKFNKRFSEKLVMDGFNAEDVETIATPTGESLNKLALEYADAAGCGSKEISKEVAGAIKASGIPELKYPGDSLVEAYGEFYEEIHDSNSVLAD